MKKIAFIIPNLKKGGMERVMSELANFGAANYEIHIVCLTSDKVEYDINPSVKLHFPSFLYQKSVFLKFKAFSFLRKQLKVIRPETVLSFSEVFNPLAIAASRSLGLKIYISDRSNPLKKHRLRDDIFRKILYPLSTGVIAQTEVAKQVFINKRYNKNIKVIPNPLKTINNINVNSDLRAIISVGRLTPSKNQIELIKVFKQINNPEWVIYFVGDGPQRSELETLVKILNLKEKIFFIGRTDDVDYWLNKASIFAFTSLSEGFPNALSEAMAFPLASIAYNCPTGVKDLIDDMNNGMLIELNNTQEYIKKLKLLMENEDLREKFMNLSFLNRKKYSIDRIGNDFFSFILSN